ncbi:MAG: hypothetical protein CMJ64_06940 [Planctomycetaceae bacterium]|nr:hypothetical protein [Planctomycetaceae bacterium]
MSTKQVIFVGKSSHHEFRDAIAWMREYCELTVCSSLVSATQYLNRARDLPNAMVLGQIRPESVQQSEVERLCLLVPSTRIIALAGGWCEGELRTGEPLRGVTRVYWHQFISRIGLLLQPEAMPNAKSFRAADRGLVVIRSTSRESFEALSETCNAVGHSTVWLPRPRHVLPTRPAYAIWDCRASIHNDREELAEFACQVYPAPVVAVLGFPRRDDCNAAISFGATTVISKPYLQSELWSILVDAARFVRHAA